AALGGLVLLAWSQRWYVVELTAASGEAGPLEVGGDVAAGALAPLALTTLALVAAPAIAGTAFRIVLGALQALVGVCVVVVALVTIAAPVAASASAVTDATGISGHDAVHGLVGSVVGGAWPVVAVVLGGLLVLVGGAVALTA